ncbi:hypothetical protein TSAR_004169 [Trichomalopsis sarcophagae]|uniref:Uncharacterized protein n=1 Tax=Trichomalopsis sarcophagae TaxID=543379 RepID=A0A232EI26_9HYME|nr:hypothetical protein TSAR_004169 [Trichomalopsis sarcophagae]
MRNKYDISYQQQALMRFMTHDHVRYSTHSLELAELTSHAVRSQHKVALTRKGDRGIFGISMPGALGRGGRHRIKILKNFRNCFKSFIDLKV